MSFDAKMYLVFDGSSFGQGHLLRSTVAPRLRMADIRWWYRVLYSTQLTKKNKSWSDGYVSYIASCKKAFLIDEHGKCLESYQPVNAGDLQDGGSFSMESYCIYVDGERISEPTFEEQKKETIFASITRSVDEIVDKAGHVQLIRRLLYTKDKVKKNKTWHDGHLTYNRVEKMVIMFMSTICII